MKKLIHLSRSASGRASSAAKWMLAMALCVILQAAAQAQTPTLETAAQAEIDAILGKITPFLIAALGIAGAFVLAKVIRRAMNKA